MNRPCADCPLKGGKCGTCGKRATPVTTVRKVAKTTSKSKSSDKKWKQFDKKFREKEKKWEKENLHTSKPKLHKKTTRKPSSGVKKAGVARIPAITKTPARTLAPQNSGVWCAPPVKPPVRTVALPTQQVPLSAMIAAQSPPPKAPARVTVQCAPPADALHMAIIKQQQAQAQAQTTPADVTVAAPEMPLWMIMEQAQTAGDGIVQRIMALPAKIARGIAERVSMLALPAPQQAALPEHKTEEIIVIPTAWISGKSDSFTQQSERQMP